VIVSPPQITYVDPDGNNWYLTDLMLSQGYVCTAIVGVSGVPVSFSSIPLLNGGALPQMLVPQPGQIAMGLYAESQGDINAYMKLLDSIAYAFHSLRNGVPTPGYLQVQRQDGSTRQLQVFTVSGTEVPTDETSFWSTYAIALQSDDPYWYDLNPMSKTYVLAGQAVGILPLLPIALGASTVFGSDTITNDGGAEAYPVWTITGPGLPVIQNVTTGRQFSFNTALTSGQVIQVDTRPGRQSAVDVNAGVSVWSQIIQNSPRDLWSLARGDNKIFLTMGGAGPGSSVVISWYRRWLRA
jgi:hypothetical protein